MNNPKEQPIAVAFSDLHWHDWENYSVNHSRLYLQDKIFEHVSQKAHQYNVPVLFSGDLFHNPKSLTNRALEAFVDSYKKWFEDRGIKMYAISGNHDLCEKNTDSHISPSYVKTFSKLFYTLTCLDISCIAEEDNFMVYGIPYLNKNKGFNLVLQNLKKIKSPKTKILLIHTDLHNAKTNEFHKGVPEGIPGDMDEYFAFFDYVLAGHIHIPQQLGASIYMLGPPSQQSWVESGYEMGFYLIYRERKPKFLPLGLPQFKEYDPDSEPPNDGNYWAPKTRPLNHPLVVKDSKFSASTNKVKLAKNYLDIIKEDDPDRRKALIDILKEL